MKRIIIGLIVLILTIAAISIGFIHSQTQAPPAPALPSDLGKLEYKFNKDEVVVYRMTQDKTVSSEHEYFKNAGGHAVENWYTIIKTENVTDEYFKLLIGGVSELESEYQELARYDFTMTKIGELNPMPSDYWLFLNQPRFPTELKDQWETPIVMVFGLDKTKDPLINIKAKYKIRGTEKVSNIDCLVIESELTANETVDIGNDKIRDEIELQDKAITYFAYKEGKVLKMDLNHYYKITAYEGEESIVMRDEYATSKYELSDRKFTQVQLDAWLYDKYPEVPDEGEIQLK